MHPNKIIRELERFQKSPIALILPPEVFQTWVDKTGGVLPKWVVPEVKKPARKINDRV
jgi:hypothetical protein